MTIPNFNVDGRIHQTFHPVQLSRISGTDLENSRYIIDNQFIYPVEVVGSKRNPLLAFTFCPSIELRAWQKELTGSDKAWSDIVLQKVLSDTASGRTKGLVKDVVNEWTIASLTQQRFSLLNLDVATLTVMHELIHSTAMGLGKDICM